MTVAPGATSAPSPSMMSSVTQLGDLEPVRHGDVGGLAELALDGDVAGGPPRLAAASCSTDVDWVSTSAASSSSPQATSRDVAARAARNSFVGGTKGRA